MVRKTLIHKHTNLTTTTGGVLSPKLPTVGTLEKGEIAVNYKNGYETLSIENDAGEIIPFASLEQTMAYTDASVVNADWNATSGKAQILNKPDIPDEKLSSSYQTSTLENDNLLLAGGDTYETAFSKMEKAILDNEETVAASLNDLNIRKIEIDDVPTKTSELTNDSGFITDAGVTSVNGQTGSVTIEIPENQLSNNYSPSTLINEDLFLEAGDTYEEAFSKLEKSINNNEQIASAALSDLDSRIPTKTSDLDNDSLPSQDSILFPNFNNLTPINTIEFDVSATTYYKLFERINTGVSNLKDVNEIIKFRITVTGTNIYSESDVIVIMPLALIYPTILGYNRTLSNAAATTGLMYIRCCYPKTLNNNYPWMTELRVYNNTARHVKIEIFESPENITWITSKTSTTYNSTYLAAQEVLFYTRRGFISSGVSWMAGDVQGTATSAAYINSYLDVWIGGTLPLTGEALTTNSLIYMSGGKLYKATNKTMPIEPFVGIIKTGTSYNAGVTPSYAYLQLKISWTALTGDSALVIPTLTRGDQVYLRCTMNNGNIYSDGTLSTTMDAGYTWVHIGTAQSATAINLDTCGKFFITLASDGKITHINGKAIQGGSGGSGDENIIEVVKVNGTALTPDANKAVNVVVPTTLSGLTGDTTHRTVTDTEKSTWNGKQDALVSGTNIKTINNESILGNGNITIQGGSGGDVNIIETVKVNGTALTPDSNKAVDITVPTKITTDVDTTYLEGNPAVTIRNVSQSGKISIDPSGNITLYNSNSANVNVNTSAGKAYYNSNEIATINQLPTFNYVFKVNSTNGVYLKVTDKGDDDHTTIIENIISSSDPHDGWGHAGDSALATVGLISSKVNAKYTKPSTGIPKTDLASAVQTSLGLADTALQSFTETDPTVQAWAKNNIYFAASQAQGDVLGFDSMHFKKSNDYSTGVFVQLANDAGQYIDYIVTSADPQGAIAHGESTRQIPTLDYLNSTYYKKPSTGIPKSDLASAVQTSLGKADTALQSYTETDPTVPAWAKAASKPTYTAAEVGALPDTYTPPVTSVNGQTGAVNLTIPAAVTESTVSGWGFTKNAGTITGITMNGSSKGTSGVVNLGTVITSETSLSKGTTSGSGNAVTDISVSGHTITLTKGSTFLTSHQNIKTINNNSLVGTGNVSIDTLPTVTASDNGKVLQVVNGAWSLVMPTAIYSGTSTPNNSVGNDGDLYLLTS